MNLRLKIPPPVIGLTAALLMWLLANKLPQFDFTIKYSVAIAIALAFCGLMIDIMALLSFKSARTTINPMTPEKTSSLVDTGIYQYSRNPMYLGLLTLLSAWAVYLQNYISVIVIPIFILYITIFQIIPEEKIMQSNFAQHYTDYCLKVRRWI